MHSRVALAVLAISITTSSILRGAEPPAGPDVAALVKVLASGDPKAMAEAADTLSVLGPDALPAAPALAKALLDKDPEVQWHAARAIASLGPAAKIAGPALVASTKSPNPMVRAYAAYALGRLGDNGKAPVEALANLLDDQEADVRRAAISAIMNLRPEPAVIAPVMRKALEHLDPAVAVPALQHFAEAGEGGVAALIEALKNEKAKYWAVIALGRNGAASKSAVPEITKLVADPGPQVRMQAVIALGEIGPDAASAAPALTKALSDELNAVRYGAAFALGQIGAKDAIPELTKQLDSKDSFLKMISAWALAKLKPGDMATLQRAVQLLVDSLKDADPRVRAAAARGLAELDAPRDVVAPVMHELLADKDPVVRGNVIDALSTLGEMAVPRLAKALDDDTTESLAVEVVRRLGPKAAAAVPDLIDELSDTDPEHRREVLFALAAIGPEAKDAVPALLKALEDEEPRVRYTACYALGKIGPAAAAAVPTLQKNMASDDKFLKVTSVWALLRIQPNEKPLRLLAVPLLAKALDETDRDLVKVECAVALGEMGPLALPAVPVLEKAAKEGSPEVQAAAQAALKAIKPKLP